MAQYKCLVCGYVHEEAAEGTAWTDLPDDWQCPVCSAGKAKFERIDTEDAPTEVPADTPETTPPEPKTTGSLVAPEPLPGRRRERARAEGSSTRRVGGSRVFLARKTDGAKSEARNTKCETNPKLEARMLKTKRQVR